jgi:hypothetical protein
MSWGFSFGGSPKAVAEAVREKSGSYCPQGVKDAVSKIAESVPENALLIVESNGHIDDKSNPNYHGGSGTLTFKMCRKAEELDQPK